MQKKWYESPPCHNSHVSVGSESCQDPIGMTLGGRETSGHVRGVGYGYCPDTPELARKRDLEQGLPPFHSHAHEPQSQVDDITVRACLIQRNCIGNL